MTWRRPAAGALDVALLSLAFATAALGLVLSATTIGGLPWGGITGWGSSSRGRSPRSA